MPEHPRLDLDAPRGPAELIATTLQQFGRHAALFLWVTLIVVAPVTILVDGVWRRGLVSGSHALHGGVVASICWETVDLVTPVLVTALHVVVVRELGSGRVPDVGAALRAAAPRFPAALATVLAYTAVVFVGFCALIVPGVWLLVRGYFCAQAVVMEGMGPLRAVGRSGELVRGRWWSTAGTLLIAWIGLSVAFVPVGLAVRAVHAGVPYIVLLTLVRALQLSLSALFGTLLYFSLLASRSRPPALVGA